MSKPEAILPRPLRDTFEQFGVIKPVAWPKLDLLAKALKARKYRYEVSTDASGAAAAIVKAMGRTFTAMDDEPDRALAKAFYEALKVTGSAQVSFLGTDAIDEDEEEAEDDEEPDAVTLDSPPPGRTANDPRPAIEKTVIRPDGSRSVEIEEVVYSPATGRYIVRETGELVDPVTSAQLAGAQARVLAEQKRR